MNTLSKWRQLPFDEKTELGWFLVLLPWVACSLRCFGYLRTRAFLSYFVDGSGLHDANATQLLRAQRSAELVALAGRRGLIRATCLRQSLLLEYWLKRRGLAATIKIGVRKEQDDFDAHAWVELNQHALGQTQLQHQAFPEAQS